MLGPLEGDIEAKYLPKKVDAITTHILFQVHGLVIQKTKLEFDSLDFPVAILQYFFKSGLEEELKLAPHGNRKDDSQPFFRTASSAMIHQRDQCSRNQKVEHDVWKVQGGMAWVENTSKVPRSRQQIYEIKRDNVAASHCSVDAVTFGSEVYEIIAIVKEH